MNLIKGFFSKIFNSRPQNALQDDADDLLLKEAARDTVLAALQSTAKPEKTTKSFHHINSELLNLLEEYNENFFRSFHISKENYKIRIEKKNIIVQVNNKEFEKMLSKSDKLSIAYEFIFQRILQTESKKLEYRIFLQAGNSSKKHIQYMNNMARKLAEKVIKNERKIAIPSKSSYERSIIHGVIEKIPGVSSKSTGPHHQRRLVIYPNRHDKSAKLD